jgi:CheY-like chemotaxis protein
VKLARNGADVVKAVSMPGPPDVLVLDLDLPDANGAEIMETLEKRMPTPPPGGAALFRPRDRYPSGPVSQGGCICGKTG